MKLKRDTKFGERSTFRFKIDIENLTNFDVNTLESLKNFDFNGLLLSKLHILCAEKVKRSYLS